MQHEDAVLQKHPDAYEFRPARNAIGGVLAGWTFTVAAPDGGIAYGWITADLEVSVDRLSDRKRAVKNLRAYWRSLH